MKKAKASMKKKKQARGEKLNTIIQDKDQNNLDYVLKAIFATKIWMPNATSS